MEKTIKRVSCGTFCADFSDDGRIFKYNDGLCALTGYTGEQFENKEVTFFTLIPPEDHDEYMENVRKLQDVGGGTLEHRILCADGTKINVICIGEDFTDDAGNPCVSVMISNITDRVDLQRKYVRSELEIAALIDNLPGGIFVGRIRNRNLEMVKASDEYRAIIGGSDIHSLLSLMSEKDIAVFAENITECLKTQLSFEQDIRLKKPDGATCWICFKARYFDVDTDGSPMIYCSVTDITDKKEAERAIIKQSVCFKMISENTEELFYEYDSEEDIMTVTTPRTALGGGNIVMENYLEKGKCGTTIHADDKQLYLSMWSNALAAPTKGTAEFRTNIADGNFKWYRAPYVSVAGDGGEVSHVYGMLYSVEHMKSMKSIIAKGKQEIERLSNTDQITGLYNRTAFTKFASIELAEKFNRDECFAVVYSDINDFSYVNENFGYEAGNRMLYDFADVIRDRDISIVGSRIYSDYFVSLNKAPDRETLVREIGKRNAEFTQLQKSKYPMSNIQVSCGVYFIRSGDEDINVAMDNANLARRNIKGSKDIPCGVYSERMRKKRSHDQTIASEIWNAIKSGAIELFLQPKFDLKTREIIGAEALTRWRNPDGTYKMPYEFIDVLENVGSIIQLDFYIYEQVLRCLAKWKNEGKKLVPVSVNFSRKHNSYPDFVERVCGLADFYNVDKNLVEIEVTESCFTQDVAHLFSNMRRFREQGFKVDIDDFGMGYSSLSVLMDAPVDIVKVDKVFIDDIGVSEKSRDYINKMCSLIETTDKDIIFEGVETEEQAVILCEGGHRMAQGWLFDKAIPVEEFDRKYL